MNHRERIKSPYRHTAESAVKMPQQPPTMSLDLEQEFETVTQPTDLEVSNSLSALSLTASIPTSLEKERNLKKPVSCKRRSGSAHTVSSSPLGSRSPLHKDKCSDREIILGTSLRYKRRCSVVKTMIGDDIILVVADSDCSKRRKVVVKKLQRNKK